MSRITVGLRQLSETGMVSIMTTMVLMMVISLIVLGFAQVSRRNQKEATDRQLSSQAFYAAESGINDAREIINAAVESGNVVRDKTACTGSGTAAFYAGLNPNIDAAKGIKYSCLLVDPTPKSLSFTNIGTTSTVVPIDSTTSTIANIKIDWQAKDIPNPMAGCPPDANERFSPTSGWTCGYGVLRFDLVPTSSATNAAGYQANTMTVFAVPTAGGASIINYAPAAANVNKRLAVACNNAGCSLTINTASALSNSFYMRITSLYRNVALQIGATDAGGTTLRLEGAQAVIDSTGKAQDVLRRLQVRIPIRSTTLNELSDYAIESSGSLCKRYAVMTGYISNSATGGGPRLCDTFSFP